MKRLGVGVAGLVIALAGAEAALRPWPVQLASPWLLTTEKVVWDDDALFVRPHHREPRTYALEPSRAAVIALGDSFTAGNPVGDSAAYTVRLEARLTAAGSAVTVVNAGVGDTGPDQQLRLFERHVLPHVRPAVVVWQLYPNDLWDNRAKAVYAIRDGRLEPLDLRRHWLVLRQRIFDLTPLPAAMKRESRLFQHFLKATQLRMYAHEPRDWPGGPDAWALAKLALELDAMEGHAAERGFACYFALIEPQAGYLDRAGESWEEAGHIAWLRRSHDRLRKLLAQRRGYIAITGLEASDGRGPAWRALFADGGRDRNALGDRHFNESGYTLMADVIADRLIADGVLVSARRGAERRSRRTSAIRRRRLRAGTSRAGCHCRTRDPRPGR